MIYYARKINQTKWETQLQDADGDIMALGLDLFERDLKADKRDISLWRMDTPEQASDIQLVLGLFGEKLATFQYLLIPENALSDFEIVPSEADAKTAVSDMVPQHCNIVHVNLKVLESFLSIVANLVQTRKDLCFRVTEKSIRTLVDTAMANDRIDITKLDPALHISLSKDTKLSHRPSKIQCPNHQSDCKLCRFSLRCNEGYILCASQ